MTSAIPLELAKSHAAAVQKRMVAAHQAASACGDAAVLEAVNAACLQLQVSLGVFARAKGWAPEQVLPDGGAKPPNKS